MAPQALLRAIACAVTSALITTGLTLWQLRASRGAQERLAMQWAEQVASQATALSLYAQASNRPDAATWAASFLNQGVGGVGKGPRFANVNRVQLKASHAPEQHVYDPATGSLDYVKLIDLKTLEGIRVFITLGHAGAFGTHTPWASDIATGIVFFVLFAALWGATGFGRFRLTERAANDAPIRDGVLRWITEAKDLLNQLAGHVRDLLREAARLAEASAKSRERVDALAKKISAEATSLKSGAEAFTATGKEIDEAEQAALNAINDAIRLDDDSFTKRLDQLHQSLRKLKASHQALSESAAKVARAAEPWAQEATQANEALDAVFSATDEIGRQTRKAVHSLSLQSKQVQALSEMGSAKTVEPAKKTGTQ